MCKCANVQMCKCANVMRFERAMGDFAPIVRLCKLLQKTFCEPNVLGWEKIGTSGATLFTGNARREGASAWGRSLPTSLARLRPLWRRRLKRRALHEQECFATRGQETSPHPLRPQISEQRIFPNNLISTHLQFHAPFLSLKQKFQGMEFEFPALELKLRALHFSRNALACKERQMARHFYLNTFTVFPPWRRRYTPWAVGSVAGRRRPWAS